MNKPMLSHLALIFSLLITMTSARAQYVAIPDTNFGNWLLNSGYASCLTGNSGVGFQLDTTCGAVTSAVSIDCHYSNIYDLTGIQYFHSLVGLNCSENNLTALTTLPTNLDSLNCGANNLTALSALPGSLTYLVCNQNPLISLPALPSSLAHLQCESDLLTSLPSLPSSLSYLECALNNLGSLPILPSSLTYLDCSDDSLTSKK